MVILMLLFRATGPELEDESAATFGRSELVNRPSNDCSIERIIVFTQLQVTGRPERCAASRPICQMIPEIDLEPDGAQVW